MPKLTPRNPHSPIAHSSGHSKIIPLWLGFLTALVWIDIGIRLTGNSMAMTSAGMMPLYFYPLDQPTNYTTDTPPTTTTATITPPTTTTTTTNALPTCKQLMTEFNSPYQTGEFLTRNTQPISWIPRADGSRRLEHSLCQLHRYTAEEARQCLAGQHWNFIGDSLTRYQFMSLVYFLHRGEYPPRWERPVPPHGVCQHRNEQGQPTCSPPTEANVCNYHDWAQDAPPEKGAYLHLDQTLGGHAIFQGRLEANALRTRQMRGKIHTIAHNYMYASSTIDSPSSIVVTYFQELGWNPHPYPIQGWKWTNCAFTGTCTYPDALAQAREQQALNMSFDFQQDLPVALEHEFIQTLPPVDVVFYNRGIWGELNRSRAERLFPLLKKFTERKQPGGGGKCFFQSTTGTSHPFPKSFKDVWAFELDSVRSVANSAGCGFIDLGHLMEDFNELLDMSHEWGYVFWDNVHFRPWVYEEVNNVLLNQLCNTRM